MKHFFDCEFIEGKQDKRFLGIKYGETKPTIDLISIGIVDEDGREYYAISKDFNLKEAWNRFDVIKGLRHPDAKTIGIKTTEDVFEKKVYWLRDNVLKPIFKEWQKMSELNAMYKFTYDNFKSFLTLYGKSNKQIAKEIKSFTLRDDIVCICDGKGLIDRNPEFYAYYADYDWVVFCQLFGTMMDLPKGFPMYCRGLKQMLDEKAMNFNIKDHPLSFDEKLKCLKMYVGYPHQTNEHNALADARWNKKLYEFLQTR